MHEATLIRHSNLLQVLCRYCVIHNSTYLLNLLNHVLDIREDVKALREWVNEMEKSLASLHILMSWSTDNLREKLLEHQVKSDTFKVHLCWFVG